MRLRLVSAGYRYPTGQEVGPLDLRVDPGDRVLLAGRSGSGKSTLLRIAAGLMHRHGAGTPAGMVRVDGRDPANLSPAERTGLLGFVCQDPGDQVICGTVEDEIAFGPESMGWAPDRVYARIDEVLRWMALDVPPDRSPHRLSGGQQQRLVVGAALAAGARLLLLDEPLAQLDPQGATALLDRLGALSERGVSVVLVEHRIRACLPWASRVVAMDGGVVAFDGPAAAFNPASVRWRDMVPDEAPPPLPLPEPPPAPAPGHVVASVSQLSWSWGEVGALSSVDLVVRAGERVALLGPNGAGKSTLLAALAGRLDAPGRIELPRRVLEVPQDPDLSLFCATVEDELAYGPREKGLGREEVRQVVERVAADLSLEALRMRAPHALSRGQRLRVAVGAALACRPDLLLLDEPTAGQDHRAVRRMMDGMEQGLGHAALVFATHDVALALRRATRVVVLGKGRVVFDGPPEEIVAASDPPVALPPVAAWAHRKGLPWRSVVEAL